MFSCPSLQPIRANHGTVKGVWSKMSKSTCPVLWMRSPTRQKASVFWGFPQSVTAPCLPSASCLFHSPVLRHLTSQTVITQAVLLPRADLHQLKNHTSPNCGYSLDTLDVLLVLAWLLKVSSGRERATSLYTLSFTVPPSLWEKFVRHKEHFMIQSEAFTVE